MIIFLCVLLSEFLTSSNFVSMATPEALSDTWTHGCYPIMF